MDINTKINNIGAINKNSNTETNVQSGNGSPRTTNSNNNNNVTTTNIQDRQKEAGKELVILTMADLQNTDKLEQALANGTPICIENYTTIGKTHTYVDNEGIKNKSLQLVEDEKGNQTMSTPQAIEKSNTTFSFRVSNTNPLLTFLNNPENEKYFGLIEELNIMNSTSAGDKARIANMDIFNVYHKLPNLKKILFSGIIGTLDISQFKALEAIRFENIGFDKPVIIYNYKYDDQGKTKIRFESQYSPNLTTVSYLTSTYREGQKSHKYLDSVIKKINDAKISQASEKPQEPSTITSVKTTSPKPAVEPTIVAEPTIVDKTQLVQSSNSNYYNYCFALLIVIIAAISGMLLMKDQN